ncbi:hypothetical protein BKA63DRAFT_21641 [Paraphoma chrysanthemicola]|nr:hypothetical protein BKA63DRAFT_21641 [Paraphoma chrysanthemicola]
MFKRRGTMVMAVILNPSQHTNAGMLLSPACPNHSLNSYFSVTLIFQRSQTTHQSHLAILQSQNLIRTAYPTKCTLIVPFTIKAMDLYNTSPATHFQVTLQASSYSSNILSIRTSPCDSHTGTNSTSCPIYTVSPSLSYSKSHSDHTFRFIFSIAYGECSETLLHDILFHPRLSTDWMPQETKANFNSRVGKAHMLTTEIHGYMCIPVYTKLITKSADVQKQT